jgi:hypothetical protein
MRKYTVHNDNTHTHTHTHTQTHTHDSRPFLRFAQTCLQLAAEGTIGLRKEDSLALRTNRAVSPDRRARLRGPQAASVFVLLYQ